MKNIKRRAAAASAAATAPLTHVLNAPDCRTSFNNTTLRGKTAKVIIQMLRDAVANAEIAHSLQYTPGWFGAASAQFDKSLHSFYPNLWQVATPIQTLTVNP